MATVDYGPVRIPLQEIPLAFDRRIQDERHAELAALHGHLPSILQAYVRVSAAVYEGAVHLCRPQAPPVAVVALSSLTRTLLDVLFNVVFIFEQPSERTAWYVASGWDEFDRLHTRMAAAHGDDPDWTGWLAQHKEHVDWLHDQVDLRYLAMKPTQRRFPHPGAMLTLKGKGDVLVLQHAERRALLRFMNDWYYRELSADSHMSLLGVWRTGAALLPTRREAHDADVYSDAYRARLYRPLVALYLALLSQVAIELRFPFEAQRLLNVWKHFEPAREVQQLFAQRYEAPLTAIASVV
jgi:hypothetical protein